MGPEGRPLELRALDASVRGRAGGCEVITQRAPGLTMAPSSPVHGPFSVRFSAPLLTLVGSVPVSVLLGIKASVCDGPGVRRQRRPRCCSAPCIQRG